jgi:xanthine dehydrogenase large subunit
MINILPKSESSPHDSAASHVSGESEYIDDRPLLPHEVHVGVVYSPHAKARILNINTAKALASAGVAGVFLAHDFKHNRWGTIFEDQPLLAHDEVNYVGEAIVIIAADTKINLYQALQAVEISYEQQKPILNIATALKQASFIGNERLIERGDAINQLKAAEHRLCGRLVLRGAEHFYLENQAVIVYPLENNALEIHSSTQAPTEVQHVVAKSLGLAQNNVVTITKRLGGGFGGKETQAAPLAAYAALVAHILKRPARLVLNKDDDMIMTGKRNPYEVHYEVGFDHQGIITALNCYFHGDGGAYADLSTSILERAMAHADNAYFIPNIIIKGRVCRTNVHPHTAFRGFGGPKGVAMIEHIIEEIAHYLRKDALDIRKLNCYKNNNNITPYGQKVENNLLPDLFNYLEQSCNYRERRQEITSWNKDPNKNPRGVALTAIKFGISFTTRFLNQASALVNIHRDGSIQVATGGVEMGQGVNARIVSITARELGVNESQIRVLTTSTDKNINTSPTAASSGTDLNGAATLRACHKLKRRLARVAMQLFALAKERWPDKSAAFASEPEIELSQLDVTPSILFKNNLVINLERPHQHITFEELINQAYLSRISLSALGFYKIKNLDFNKLLGQGRPFLYFTQGVACSEVEIDRLSGHVKLLRSDILMDLGEPINDALDRGQVAGAFIQGVGWVTTEALYYNAQGQLLSHAPSTYKIPSVHDIPRIFTINLVDNKNNKINLYGTKAAGEPPLMLCFSVWNAIKNAVSFQRAKLANIAIPATNEEVLRALKPEAFACFENSSA